MCKYLNHFYFLAIRIFSLVLFIFLSTSSFAQIKADFTADTTSGCALVNVKFTNNSTGNNLTYYWDFGNGNSSTQKDPSASYLQVGKYNVKLVVRDGNSVDSIVKSEYIEVFALPVSDFTYTPNQGCAPLEVDFKSTSTTSSSGFKSYKWDFSDGSPASSGQNTKHTYRTVGNYAPSLEVIDNNGCRAVIAKPPIVVFPIAIASFNSSNSTVSCLDTHTVHFVNLSTGQNLSYHWDFGDGKSSTQANPSHKYNGFGRYDVTLIVNSSNCADTITLKEYIRLENSVAEFEFESDTICYAEEFSPINLSKGARAYSWDFGDGKGSSFSTPTHIYQDSGWFEVKLTVSAGSTCKSTYKDSIYVQRIIADFITEPQLSCSLSTDFKFIGNSNVPARFNWNIHNSKAIDGESLQTYLKYSGDSIMHTEDVYKGKRYYLNDYLVAVSNYGCTDTIRKDSNRIIEVLNAEIDIKIGSFGLTGNHCIPDSVTFNSKSTGLFPITSYQWLIDDSIYNQAPPIKVYHDKTVDYTATLLIRDSMGCVDSSKRVVKLGKKQNPKLSFFPDSICANDILYIVNESTDTSLIDTSRIFITTSNTSFGPIGINKDTTSINVRSFNMIHNAYLSLEISSKQCDTIYNEPIPVYIKGPLSSFNMELADCDSGRTVQFNNTSQDFTNFYWDFGDGSPIDSINQSPTHTYLIDSLYEVKLVTYNSHTACSDTIKYSLSIAPLPLVQITKNNRNYCLGDTSYFSFPEANLYDSIYWYIDSVLVSREASFKHFFADRGTYIVELEANRLECIKKKIDTITVSKPIATIASDFIQSCIPVIVYFADSSISSVGINHRKWHFGIGDTVYNSSNERITYYQPKLYDVYLWVQDSLGCTDSEFKKGFINATSLSVNFVADKLNICSGDSVSFRNVSVGDATTYIWRFGNGDTLETMDEFIGYRYHTSGEYQIELYGKNNDGCELTEIKTAYIKVEETPVAAFTADTTTASCYPFEVNFEDLSTGDIAKWSWYFGDDNTSGIQHPYHNYTSNGNFDVALKVKSSFGCSDSIMMKDFIKINAPNADIVKSKDSACIHETIHFSIANAHNLTELYWDFGDGSTSKASSTQHAYDKVGVRYVYITLRDSVTNCSVMLVDSIYIFNNKAEFIINADTACQPFHAAFTNTSTGADQFLWNFGDGNTNSTDFSPTHLYEQAGNCQISLMIESNIGCKDTAYQNIVVHPKPKITVSPNQQICLGDSVRLEVSGGLRYSWSPHHSLTDSSSSIQIAKPDVTTIYQVITFNEFDCSDTAEITVKVQQPPLRQAKGSQDTTLIIGENVKLNMEAGPGFYYKWTPSKGLSCDDCPNPIAKPLETTRYIVRIADSLGCFDVYDTIYIEVEEKYSLDVPNTFTPNSDGKNDIIYANGWGLQELLTFSIYNRFGEKVFESKDFDIGWDGTYKGNPQPIETYVYVVEALTYSGKVISKKGNINLIR